MTHDSETLPAATIAGRYALFAPIAAGGMATVHLGQQLGDGGFARIVAVKRLHPHLATEPDFVAMFLDEARLVARVRHPNVVQTLDVVSTAGELFVVMEYVHGDALARVLERGALPPRIAAAIVSNVLHGLHAAHVATDEAGAPLGIVHRDVSPQNILVGADGVARVIDFGVARAMGRLCTTREGQLKGKLAYMAPEHLATGDVDARADVYAASVVLWEALTGQRLFDAEDDPALIGKVLAGATVPPSAAARHVPAAFDDIVMRGLARDRTQRFASALEMAHALEAVGVASSSEVARWLAAQPSAALAARAATIATIEARAAKSGISLARGYLDRLSSAPPPVMPSRAPDTSATAATALVVSQRSHSAAPMAPAKRDGLVPLVIGVATAFAVGVAALAGVVALRLHARATSDAASKQSVASSASAPAASTVPSAAPSTSVAAAPQRAPCPPGMAFVPGGKFFMGSDEGMPAERPAHHVELPGYCIDELEVTVADYSSCVERGDCKRAPLTNVWPGIKASDSATFDPSCNARDPQRLAKHPMNCIDWSSASRFCKQARKRLPTEAEWEYAARGSDGRLFPWGDAPPTPAHVNACGPECVAWGKAHHAEQHALFDQPDGWATTAPVGSFARGRSPFGVHDLAGNVWEWVADRYGPYEAGDVVDPRGPSAKDLDDAREERVIRGGAWNSAAADWLHATFRFKNDPTARSYGVGFRCAASPLGEGAAN